MKILFWNIRGLDAEGRRRQLSELRLSHRVEIICLQETIKSDFSLGDLSALSEGFSYEWIWTASQGHSGGILVGVTTDNI
jgi:exonuclease III